MRLVERTAGRDFAASEALDWAEHYNAPPEDADQHAAMASPSGGDGYQVVAYFSEDEAHLYEYYKAWLLAKECGAIDTVIN